jgi:hypothetical protein
MSSDQDIQNGTGHYRYAILYELGRIEDEDLREQVALHLCELKPTTRKAIALIRLCRLGKRPPATPHQLADALRKTMNMYLQEHEAMPWDDVRAALDLLRNAVDATEHRANE